MNPISVISSAINTVVRPIVSVGLQSIRLAFDESNRETAVSMIAIGTFSAITWKGASMLFSPFSSKTKWISLDKRFKSKIEIKAKPINLSSLLEKIPAMQADQEKQAKELAGKTKIAANNATVQANAARAAAATAQQAADDAQTYATRTQTEATEARRVATEAQNEANRLAAVATEAQNKAEVNRSLGDYQNADQTQTEANTAEATATRLVAVANEAEAAATRRAAALVRTRAEAAEANAKANELEGTASQAKLKHEQAETLVTLAENAIKSANKDKPAAVSAPKKKDDTLPEGNYFAGFSVEKTKSKTGETQINLPFSHDAIIIKHEEMKKEFLRAAAGLSILGVGSLGIFDSFTKAFNLSVANDPLTVLGSVVGTPVQYTAHYLGKTIGWMSTFDDHGISKLGAAFGFGIAGGTLLAKTSFVWFNFKRDNPADRIVKKDVILYDLLRVVGGVTLLGTSVLSAAAFLSGK